MKRTKITFAAAAVFAVASVAAFFARSAPSLKVLSITSQHDCGPASLYLLCKAAGVNSSFADLKRQANLTAAGTSLLDLKLAAQQSGWRATGRRVSFDELIADLSREHTYAILYLNDTHHFVAALGCAPGGIVVADPRVGSSCWNASDLKRQGWHGHVLLLTR